MTDEEFEKHWLYVRPERMHEGAYGVCEGCGHRIPAARLKFQPAATRCVECQGHWDRINGRTA